MSDDILFQSIVSYFDIQIQHRVHWISKNIVFYNNLNVYFSQYVHDYGILLHQRQGYHYNSLTVLSKQLYFLSILFCTIAPFMTWLKYSVDSSCLFVFWIKFTLIFLSFTNFRYFHELKLMRWICYRFQLFFLMLKWRKTENTLHGVRNRYLKTNIFSTMPLKGFFLMVCLKTVGNVRWFPQIECVRFGWKV